MRKLQKKILAVLCASVMLVSTYETIAFAEELAEEPKENIEETVEEVPTEIIEPEDTEEDAEVIELEQTDETQIEKKVQIRSEVSENAKEGDIFRVICELEGYEEGTYEIQWQYITTDWYGNHIGEWSDLPGENDMELEVVIDEENALRAWRVIINEI